MGLRHHQFLSHNVLLFYVGLASKQRLEEEYAQDSKHNEKFEQDDYPERSSPGHVAEAFHIEVQDVV